MSQKWRVRILATVSVEGSVLIDRFPTKRAALLLIRLAFAQGRAVYRDSLCRELWPDDLPEITRTRLRQELSRLNSVLGSAREIIASDRMSLRIETSKASIDLKDAEALLSRAAVETEREAKQSVLKEFAGYAVEIAPGYGELWVDSVREDWRNRASRTLIELAKLRLDEGATEETLGYAKAAAGLHLFSESIQAAYLKFLVQLGRQKEARAHLAELDRMYYSALGAGTTEALRRKAGLDCRPPANGMEPGRRPMPKRLPAPLAGLVGREGEIAEVLRILHPGSNHRLCTLTGPGGIGKTELALAVGRRSQPLYGGRVWFVPLAGVDNPRFIASAIRDSMGIPPTEADPFESVAESIGDPPALLILDNLEQLIDGGAQLVRRLLEECESLTLLITSRRRLRIEGEHEFSVPALSAEHALQLFCQVAKRGSPGFHIEEGDSEAVRSIVEILDRLPLAIQIAASRTPILSPKEMLSQLSRRFDLLVSRRLDIEPRHRTLRQTIAWTYDQLSKEAQQLLLDLSLFRGGWTLGLAEEVLENPDSLTLMEELSDHSLITTASQESESRFKMLHSIREFAIEGQDSERAERQMQKMADVLLRLSTDASRQLLEEDQVLWYGRLQCEYENIRRALQFAAERDPNLGLHLCARLWRFWTIKGYHVEAKGWFERLIPPEAEASLSLGNALFGAARCAYEQGELDLAEGYYLRTLEVFEKIGREEWLHGLKANLVEVYLSRRELEKARHILLDSMDKGRSQMTSYLWAIMQDGLAAILIEMGLFEEAKERLDDTLRRFAEYHDQVALANAYTTYGRLLVRTGESERALSMLSEALSIYIGFSNRSGIGMSKQLMAELALRQGRLSDVEQLCAESSAERLAIRDRYGLAHLSLLLAETQSKRGDEWSAARHFGDAAKHFRACGCDIAAHEGLYKSGKTIE